MATKKVRNEEQIQEELDVVQDKIDEIDEELEETEKEPVKKAKKTKKGELKVVEQEAEETEKKSLKEKAKEFGENHPKVVKWGKRIVTGAAVVAAGVLGYKAGQDSMIDDGEWTDLDEVVSDEE
ncbi:MAG: hypothetical protein J6Y86_04345 [Pseudobutyrivibrio sp.]|nr:hypothetical protein [Pseudobutyrivibrio sp.]